MSRGSLPASTPHCHLVLVLAKQKNYIFKWLKAF